MSQEPSSTIVPICTERLLRDSGLKFRWSGDPSLGQRKRSSSSCFPDCLAPSIFDKKDLVTVSQFAHGLRLKVKRG